MKATLDTHISSRTAKLSAIIVAAMLGMGGCTAMEGVNVGASVPIGGIVNVSANKRLGDSNNTSSQKPSSQQSSSEVDAEEDGDEAKEEGEN